MAILKSTQARAGHAAGIFSDMTLDGPEIGTLVAVIDRAKNLPNRKTIGKQDPYCAMRLGKEAKKTDTDRRGGQTPKWDQELRFTVHDSPDYYKLKCSVFNDDKKTDLIGETWVDLSDVIRLGGGQNDLWQQLSFKGKYAGEIRVELTFYDAREKPLPQEKRKPNSNQEESPSGSTSDLSLSGPRSLGPREIKRRPLPASPAALASTQSTTVTIAHSKPELPPKLPIEENARQYQQTQLPQLVHAPVPIRPRGSSTSPQPQHSQYDISEQYMPDEDSTQYPQYQQSQISYAPHADQPQQQRSWQESTVQQHHRADHQYYDPIGAPSGTEHNPYDRSIAQQTHQPQASVYPGEDEMWLNQRPQSIHTHSAPITPHISSPAHRPSPATTNSDSQIVQYHQQQRSDAASSRQSYADSPLRQSVSHHELDLPLAAQFSVPPPLPPKHRDTPPRRPRNEYPPSAYIPQPLRTSGNRSSVAERSPLQSLEDDYLMHRQERSIDVHTPQRQSMYEPYQGQYYETPEQHEIQGQQQLELHNRRRTYDEQYSLTQSHPQQQPQRPLNHNRRRSYEIKHASYSQQVVEEPHPMTPHDGYHSGQEDGYQPFVEDAPPSPGLQPAVARKAVGAQPKKLSGVPFGPDAYNVLNPASSPVTNERTKFQTPEQSKEAERLREVEKIRELGPIIGNDGRIIDPSDHLPSDTWAPEPERKNRKPEHVIHIRSKNDPKRPSGARASPLIIKHTGPQSIHSSPAPDAASSPAVRTTPSNFAGGRNRLQKSTPTPARALPNQPYSSPAGHVASSPALATSPQNMYEERRPSHERRPSYDNRVPSHLARPPLSEYQVPVGNSYTPRSGSYDSNTRKTIEPAYETPTKQQSYHAYSSPAPENYQRRNSYDNRENSYERRNSGYAYDDAYSQGASPAQQQQVRHYDDPLAAELSLIDIGPSRRGQAQDYNSGAMVRSRGRW